MFVTSLTISLRGSLLIPSLRYSFSSEAAIISTVDVFANKSVHNISRINIVD